MALFINIVYLLLTVKSFSPHVIHKTYVIDGHLRLRWKEAAAKCVQSGMELVNVESKAEGDMLKKLIEPSQSVDGETIAEMDFWTSGQRREDGTWCWTSNGKPFSYTDWAPGSPSDYGGGERCLRLWGNHHLQWDDFLCSARLHYICQKNLLPAGVVKGAAAKAHRPTTTTPAIPKATKMILVPVPDEDMDELLQDEDDDDDYTPTLSGMVKEQSLLQMPAMNLSGAAEIVVRLATTPEVVKPPTPKKIVRVVEVVRKEDEAKSFSLIVHQLNFVVFKAEKQRWLEAKDFCVKLGMNLAVLANDNERCRLSQFLTEKKYDQSCFWLRDWEKDNRKRQHPVHEDFHRRKPPPSSFLKKHLTEMMSDRDNDDDQVQFIPNLLKKTHPKKCPLLIPSKDVVVYRECWIRCRVVCEQTFDFP